MFGTLAGMAAREVVDPQGRTWKVRRRWVHRSVRWRGARDLPDAGIPGLDFLDDELGIFAVIGLVITSIAVVALGIFFVIPAVIFMIELVLVVLALLLGGVARLLLRRPWTVEARIKGTNEGREWKVVGWRASGDLVD
ncbi:MAG: hypothetical protein M3Q68_10135, partial [Actinomycetota bacterium]|nr:hypothetical protein [Actinomycetota bacterium]